MSLYVGHLSPHVRPDELERVFRRFGRCNLQLKDGYGFVVYEVIANAERALRALRGKQVCGEPISLNWSNKQPMPFQRPTRGSRFDEPYPRRVFREDDNVLIPPCKDEDGDSVRQTNRGGDNLMDEENGEVNSLENDRWGEPTGDMLLPGHHGAGKGYEFDRYEPYHGYSKRDEKCSSDSSPPYRGLHEKRHKEQQFIVESEKTFDKSIPHLVCYNCGQVGHIKRKCPEGDCRRDRFSKFEQTRDEVSFREKMEGRRKKFRANSWGRPSTSRDPFVARRPPAWDTKDLHSSKSGKPLRTRPSPERREKRRSKQNSESRSKKRSNKRSEKKRRERVSSSDTSSSIFSYSSKSKSISGTRPHSTSRSASSKSHPTSSRSRSISFSSYDKSKSSRSRSRSLSLSISLGQNSSSSLKDAERKTSGPESNFKEKTLEGGNGSSPLEEDGRRFDVFNGGASASEYCAEQGVGSMKPAEQVEDESTRISTEEMLAALRHYGLVPPKEVELDVSVEDYFGAARLWPWEMIYYRRLKRGPICNENYAKRLKQNEEFGISDKYIRSSSGWGECQKDT